MTASRRIPLALAVAAVFALMLATSTAHAYPWMIRHGYTGCTPCHTDPSGGAGALTEYGRAQGDLLLRMRYGVGEGEGEADRSAGFLWGLVPMPDAMRMGGDFREGFFSSQADGAPIVQQLITMRADLYGDIKIGRFRAAGSIGYVPQGDLTASLTTGGDDNIVSREHWVGVELDDEGSWLLRAGRITLPFGIRMVEHTLWARTLTRTDLDASQQYGLSLSVNKDKFRGELMGIAGNFQIQEDEFRERGYCGFFEYAPTTTLAAGVSSMFTRATRDIVFGVTDYRYSNGPFVRYAPWQPLVLLAELDSVYQSLTWNGHRGGYAGFVQADYEPTQGLHLMLTGETMNGGAAQEPSSYDAWFSAVWFALPHVDLRLDTIYAKSGVAGTPTSPSSYTNSTSWLAQFHVWL
jgi:hypothetical protein